MSATITETAITTIPITLSGAQDSSYIPRGPVRTKLYFFEDPADGAKPFSYVEPQPEGQPQSNYGVREFEVEINDIRGHEKEYYLDKNAFQVIEGVSSDEKDFIDDEHIKNVYYPEVEKLLLDNVPGAHKVTIFDHTIRRPNTTRGPVLLVHIDQTAKATEARVKRHNPEEADELLKGRYRIINVWRPLNGPIQAHPLAFGSADSVDDNDLVPVDLIYPDRTGETAGVRHNEKQKFFYLSGMKNDESLFLKCYDSKVGVGQRVPHTAFVDPRTPVGARERESIEVRALVYG